MRNQNGQLPQTCDRAFSGQIRGVNSKTGELTGVASTGAIDRYGEVILPEAFNEKQLENPQGTIVFAASHWYINYKAEPTILGRIEEARRTDEGLYFRAQFDMDDPLAVKWMKKVANNNIKGVSIGFRSVGSEWRDLEVAPGVTKKVKHYTAVDLLEISLTPVPANPEATVRQAGADAEQIRDLIRAETAGAIQDLRACVMEIVETQARLVATVGQLADHVRDGNNEILASLTPTELTELPVKSVGGESPKQVEQQEVVESLRRIKDELEGDKDA